IKLKEDIKEMSDRFTIIINRLKSYRKIYPNEEVKKESSKRKHKANVTTWSDEDSSDDEDQEVTNLCLMTINDSK
ncbi:hypothetical protein J1N35_041575, partial [Gossypium stocksii]